MASVRNVIDMSNYCDTVYGELGDAKAKLLGLIETIQKLQGPDRQMVDGAHNHGTHDHISHLQDIVNMIDWKLEILTKVCPTNWMKYAAGAETVSVRAPEVFEDSELGDYGW